MELRVEIRRELTCQRVKGLRWPGGCTSQYKPLTLYAALKAGIKAGIRMMGRMNVEIRTRKERRM